MNKFLKMLKGIDSHPLIITKNYKLREHRGIGYLFWRIQRPLLKFHYKVYFFFNPNTPWICITATEFLKKYLTKDMVGAEFGSGRSTIFNALRCKYLVSIEHHQEWYSLVKKKLTSRNMDNIDYRFVGQQERQPIGKLPEFYNSWGINQNDYEYRTDYENYFSALNDFEDHHFDFLFVDGRARPECVFTAEKKLKSGGLLMLDNSERERYNIVFQKLSSWESYTCTSGLTDTTFWIKP